MYRTDRACPRKVSAIDKEIGALIQTARINAQLSQTALGSAIGVSFQQIQKYERGVNRVAVSTLADISNALRTPLAVLLPEEWLQMERSDCICAADTAAICTIHARLNAKERALLLRIAELLVSKNAHEKSRKASLEIALDQKD